MISITFWYCNFSLCIHTNPEFIFNSFKDISESLGIFILSCAYQGQCLRSTEIFMMEALKWIYSLGMAELLFIHVMNVISFQYTNFFLKTIYINVHLRPIQLKKV